ncbi:hypothetical protein BJY04DRAFT_193043 [Aspergillus karnatakaensis]|uniref:uncharacterized protein n=1 Tax=Aspergillus karnatakaensis TaxID=1810916 RepID=UPI003CCDF463
MSLQHPVRRWALRPANLFSISSTTTRLITRRPFSLFQEAQRQTSLRTIQSQPQFQSQLHQALRTRRGFHNSRPRFNRSSYTYQAPNGSPSLSQRLKTLSKEYGWSALWIYLFLSALDFPFCFAAVKLLGADKIGHYEQVVVEGFKRGVNKIWSGAFEESKDEDREEAAAEKKKGSAEEASMCSSSLNFSCRC